MTEWQPATDCSTRVQRRRETHSRKLLTGSSYMHDQCRSWRPQVSSGNKVRRTPKLRWQVYDGAILCWQRNASTVRRYSFNYGAVHSTWRSRKSEVTWLYFRTEKTSQAVAFMTVWSLTTRWHGRPARVALPRSERVNTNETTNDCSTGLETGRVIHHWWSDEQHTRSQVFDTMPLRPWHCRPPTSSPSMYPIVIATFGCIVPVVSSWRQVLQAALAKSAQLFCKRSVWSLTDRSSSAEWVSERPLHVSLHRESPMSWVLVHIQDIWDPFST